MAADSRFVQHTTRVSASADVLYELIADAPSWPTVLGPTIHVERLESNGVDEVLQLWATANDSVRTWRSRRHLDPEARRISFRQVQSPPPLTSMGGAWILRPVAEDVTEVVLDHDFSVVDNDPEALEWFTTAVDRNSTEELAAMKRLAENWADRADLTMTFDDSVQIAGDAVRVYDFLCDAGRWPERIPHVSSMELTEPSPGLQVMTMDTSTADGSVHTTRSVRVCFPSNRIVYKQVQTPTLMAVHTGEWIIAPNDDGVLATSRHTVVIRPETVTTVLGPDATVADARKFVREALGRNSGTTLRYAKNFAEAPDATAAV
ncbi:cyclase [Planosporangium thailandense]|uniref:Cyclase n=1 Tax=Planosporangium thailandense TaxID=765197 RepID=A0ABX0XVV0_9ACTN|nr:cyclase [Planosporangium thailandense]